MKHKTNFCIGGSFTPEGLPPTCTGLHQTVMAWNHGASHDEIVHVSREVFDAIWAQALPPAEQSLRVFNTIDEVSRAVREGWLYNADEGDGLFMYFGDIHPIRKGDRFIGVGCRAPDGAIIRDGRELVAWRDRRWAHMRGPEYLRAQHKAHPLHSV